MTFPAAWLQREPYCFILILQWGVHFYPISQIIKQEEEWSRKKNYVRKTSCENVENKSVRESLSKNKSHVQYNKYHRFFYLFQFAYSFVDHLRSSFHFIRNLIPFISKPFIFFFNPLNSIKIFCGYVMGIMCLILMKSLLFHKNDKRKNRKWKWGPEGSIYIVK